MATIKVLLRQTCRRVASHNSTALTENGTIAYKITHRGTSSILRTQSHLHVSEWDARHCEVIISEKSPRRSDLIAIRKTIRLDLYRLEKIITELNSRAFPYTATDVVNRYHHYIETYSITTFTRTIITQLRENGKIRTAETYTTLLNSFMRFRDGNDIMLDAITHDTVESYEAFMRTGHLVPNTTSFYMRILRAIYNRAVEAGAIEQGNVFRHVYTGVDKTMKRAIDMNTIRDIKKLDLSQRPALDFARDMFLFSFYTRGMSLIDMAYLRKTDLHNGYLHYRRRKTGQMLTIQWTPEMQSILNKYPVNTNDYLLPVITDSCINLRARYRTVGYRINHYLKQIGQMVKCQIPLTLYCARHSWASAAKTAGIPVAVISEGLGHDSESTTRIYLTSLDTSVVDKANAMILHSI